MVLEPLLFPLERFDMTAANGTPICFCIDCVGFCDGLLVGCEVAKVCFPMHFFELVTVSVMDFVVSIDLRNITYVVVFHVPPIMGYRVGLRTLSSFWLYVNR